MGSLLQVRDVPEEARRALKARAASRGQSLNSYMLALIEREVACPTVAEVLTRAGERTERATDSAVEAINSARRERDQQLTLRVGT